MSKKNSKSKMRSNSGPYNNPMEGIFNIPIGSQTAAASNPFEMSNSASYNLISLQRIILTYSYVIFGPIRTLVDQPVYDAMRGGIKIKTDEVDPEEIEEIYRDMKKLKFIRVLINAMRWDRLFGGAGVIINTDQNYEEELNIESITEDSPLEFKAADRWELAWNGIPNDERSYFSYYGKKIHQSRVAKIVGEEAPSMAAQRLQGWGMSCIECVIREINSYFKEHNLIFEMIDEAKIDVYKIKGFNSSFLKPLAQGKNVRRLQMANSMKNFMNAIMLDSEDDYEQKTLTFSGLSDILEQIRIGIAAAVRMPMAKIFGLAAKGFASGEDDIENYNAIVEGQRDRVIDILDMTVPILFQKRHGFVPDDLSYEFKPLRVLTAEQEQNVKNSKFNRIRQMRQDGILNPVEYCELLKQEDLLTMDTEVGKGIVDPEDNMPRGMMTQDEETPAEGSTKKPSDGKESTKPKE